jgi:RNAse (barnase) inhibitor barstar
MRCCQQLGAPSWHGHTLDALHDSIFAGEINEIEPPFRIVVRNTAKLHNDLKAILRQAGGLFDDGRKETGLEAYFEFRPQR